MPLPSAYKVGTVTVAAGGTSVTGTGTNFLLAGIRAGDILALKGLTVTIASVESATALTLDFAWPGTAQNSQPYEVRYVSDATRVLAAAHQAMSSFEGGTVTPGPVAWADITGIPSTFPPSTHSHGWGQITNKPTTFTPAAHRHNASDIDNLPALSAAWNDITGKPATFPPATHTHTTTQVTGLDAALTSKSDVGHTHVWSEITGKPATFAPAAHTHDASEITNLPSGGTSAYLSQAAFFAATIPSSVNIVTVVTSGEAIDYVRTPGANGAQDLQHPNGSSWAKGDVSRADIVSAITDVTTAIDRIPFQSGAFGGMTITAQTPGTFSCTYTVQRISWQRVGHTVTFEFRIAGTPTLGTATGQLRITGFPFAASATSAGGATLRAGQGINLRHYVSGTPSSPAYVSGYFPDGVSYMLLSAGAAAGEAHSIIPIDRLTSGTPFRIEAFGQYEIQI